MKEEKVKVVLEFRNCVYGLKVISVEPREISEEFKDKIWYEYSIDIDGD